MNLLKKYLPTLFMLLIVLSARSQTWNGTEISFNHPTFGSNSDYTSIYRADTDGDFTRLRINMGDEYTSEFQVGYNSYWGAGWFSTFSLDGYGNTYMRGNLGIGMTSPNAKITFNNLNDGTDQPDGITWYNPSRLDYGIYRTAGPWAAPNYQQLRLNFETGIILYPGSAYGKSYVDIQGGGLRVTSGNVGIGTTSPGAKLEINQAGQQLKLTGGSVAAGIWTSATDVLYLADWNSGTRGLNINMTSGNVGIGTFTADYRLTVNGRIKAEEVQVVVDVPADYVFEKDYQLLPLSALEKFIDENKHLPGVPDAKNIIRNGWKVGEMNNKMLEKIEELTLYIIQQNKVIEALQEQNNKMQEDLHLLKSTIAEIKK